MAADIKFNGLHYAQYEMVTSDHDTSNNDAKGRHAFEITRAFFGADVKVDDNWSGHMLLDAMTNGTGVGTLNNAVYLRNLYVKHSNLLGTGLNVAMGQLGNVWNAYGTALWGHRFITLAPATGAPFTADSDKGLKVDGKIPAGYGNFELLVSNGEGANATEAASTGAADPKGHKSRGKDVSMRVAIIPMPQHDLLKSFQVHGVVYQGVNPAAYGTDNGRTDTYLGSHRRDKWLVAASFKNATGHAMVEYFETRTGVGTVVSAPGATQALTENTTQKMKNFSVHGSYKTPWYNLGVLGRYDRMDKAPLVLNARNSPTTIATGYAPERLVLVGVTWTPNANVRLALVNSSRMRKDAENYKDLSVGFKENKVGLYSEVKF